MKASSINTTVIFLLLITVGFLTALPSDSAAQGKKIELTPMVGYQFGGSMKFIEGKFKLANGLNYGGALSFELRHQTQLELSYTRMDTDGDWRKYSGYPSFPEDTNNIEVAVNYLQVGSVKEIPIDNEKLVPFGLFSIGATWFHPKATGGQDEWLFSLAAGAGLKIFFTERIGIRLQGRLLLPLIFSGAGFYIGIGPGGVSPGLGVSSTSPIVQGDFQGGLIIALGK